MPDEKESAKSSKDTPRTPDPGREAPKTPPPDDSSSESQPTQETPEVPYKEPEEQSLSEQLLEQEKAKQER